MHRAGLFGKTHADIFGVLLNFAPHVFECLLCWVLRGGERLVSFVAGLGVLLLSLVMLPVASVVNTVLNIWMLYSLSGLLAAAHQFKSPIGGLFTVVLTIFAVAFGLLVAFIILGVGSSMGA